MMSKQEIPEEEELLHKPESSVARRPTNEKEIVTWMSLPNKPQLFLLALCRLSEPLSNTCLLPYIYYLVKSIISNGDDDESAAPEISRLSGLLVAAFPLAQFATSMLWGRLSDIYGRKSIITIGLLASVIANMAFGFSRSVAALFFWRVLAGLGNGNTGVMRTMTAEIVKERKYQTRAFLILPLVFNSGMVAGLALGGCLADPVINMAWLFGPNGLLNVGKNEGGVAWTLKYPYALPVMINAIALGISLILAILGLRETLPGKEDERDHGILIGQWFVRYIKLLVFRKRSALETTEYTAVKLEDFPPTHAEDTVVVTIPKPAAPRPNPPFRNIWTRDVLVTLISFGLLPLHNSAFMHIFPIFLSTPVLSNTNATLLSFTGGLGLQSPSIGLWLACFGICGVLLQLFIYPRMQARLGTLGCFRVSLFVFPLAYIFAPYLSLLPSKGVGRWAGIAAVLVAQVMARTVAIPSTVILLTESAPSKAVLGTVHGAGNMLSSLARAVGTAVGGVVLAWGLERGVVGAVWWCYLLVISLVALGWSYTMRKVDDDRPKGRQDLVQIAGRKEEP